LNSFGDNSSGSLLPIVALLNHSKDENVLKYKDSKSHDYTIVSALRDIEKGEEIVHDYAKS